MCNILHHFSEETNRAILKKVHAALRPGGSVGIFDIETPEECRAARDRRRRLRALLPHHLEPRPAIAAATTRPGSTAAGFRVREPSAA